MSSAATALRSSDIELIYLDLGALGRGEVLRLLLNAWDIPFKDTRIPMSEWPAKKAELIKTGVNPSGLVPVLIINSRSYPELNSIARYLARQLGLYGKDAELDFYADAVADSHQEWRSKWAAATFSGSPDAQKSYMEQDRPAFLQRFEAFLARYPDGPFVCGSEFTFADAAVYQMIDSEEKLAGERVRSESLPLLSRLYEAVEQLPRISAYLKARQVLPDVLGKAA